MRGYVPGKTKHLTMSKTSLSDFLKTDLCKCQWTHYLSTMSGYCQWCSMQKIICTHIFILRQLKTYLINWQLLLYVVGEVMWCCHYTKFHWLTINIECCKQLWWLTYTVSKQIMKYRWDCCFTRQLFFPNKIFAIGQNKSDVKRWHQMKWHDVMT